MRKVQSQLTYLRKKIREAEVLYERGDLQGTRNELASLQMFVWELKRVLKGRRF